MQTIRRWYLFLVCAISFNVVAWALVNMLRTLLNPDDNPAFTFALPIAVTVIGLPLYIVHWLWAQRLAATEPHERDSLLRQVYLYGMVAAFVVPILFNAHDLIVFLMGRMLGVEDRALGIFSWTNWGNAVRERLSAILILTPLAVYHVWLARQDVALVKNPENATTVRRLFLLSFAFVGILMVTAGVNELLLQLFRQIGATSISTTDLRTSISYALAQLLIGIPLWLVCWLIAQRLFAAAAPGERDSAFRKFYLYALIFIAVFTTLTTVGGVLSAFLMNLLGIPPEGDLREVFATLIPAASLWGYHAVVLRRDEQAATEAPRQAAIRRLYLYLVAAIGLLALLGGVIGVISALIQWIDELSLDNGLRSQIAVTVSAILVGLPVWLLPWRRAQNVALQPDGEGERQSLIRRIYLYWYLFLATLAVLGSAIYSLYRILSLLLGEPLEGSLLTDIAHALAFLLIGVGVWLYHGMVLREDGQRSKAVAAQQVADWQLVIVEEEAGQSWVAALTAQLKEEMPSVTPEIINATSPLLDALHSAQLIVAPVAALVQGTEALKNALLSSPARKLLLPLPETGWDYAGIELKSESELVKESVETIQRLAHGEEAREPRRMNAGAIIGFVLLGVAIIIFVIIVIVLILLSQTF